MNHTAQAHSALALTAPVQQAAQRSRMVPAPAQATLSDLIDTMNARPQNRPCTDHQLRLPLWQLRPDAVLFHERSVAESIYVVRTGHLKCVRVLEDGYHQVLSFAGAGDVLGFEALHRRLQPNSAVALETATVFAISAQGLDGLRARSPAFDAALQCALSRQLARACDMAELLTAVSADTRLARFLVWLSARMVEAGQSGQRLRLRMGRRDIASMLGVAHETISRSFTRLAESGVLEVVDRDVRIIDFERLKERTRCTRG